MYIWIFSTLRTLGREVREEKGTHHNLIRTLPLTWRILISGWFRSFLPFFPGFLPSAFFPGLCSTFVWHLGEQIGLQFHLKEQWNYRKSWLTDRKNIFHKAEPCAFARSERKRFPFQELSIPQFCVLSGFNRPLVSSGFTKLPTHGRDLKLSKNWLNESKFFSGYEVFGRRTFRVKCLAEGQIHISMFDFQRSYTLRVHLIDRNSPQFPDVNVARFHCENRYLDIVRIRWNLILLAFQH